jgi:hypothetical protein
VSHYTEIGGQPSARNGEVCPLETLGLVPGACEARAGGAMPAPEQPAPSKTTKVKRLGKLIVRRCRPRRLDKRVVARRPMMLVKRRLVAPLHHNLFHGREIIART